jgi:hypothetical protein
MPSLRPPDSSWFDAVHRARGGFQKLSALKMKDAAFGKMTAIVESQLFFIDRGSIHPAKTLYRPSS